MSAFHIYVAVGSGLLMISHTTFLRGAAALLLVASGGLLIAQSGAKLPADLDPDSRARCFACACWNSASPRRLTNASPI